MVRSTDEQDISVVQKFTDKMCTQIAKYLVEFGKGQKKFPKRVLSTSVKSEVRGGFVEPDLECLEAWIGKGWGLCESRGFRLESSGWQVHWVTLCF